MPTPTIAVIVASTRPNRFADHPLGWLEPQFAERSDLNFDVVDLREHPLPFYDLTGSPAMAHRVYTSDEQRALGERFDAADGFIILTNEYNHGYTAALKNTLDHFYAEFRRKPVAFVGYGNVGGARAIEQLRQVVGELEMAAVKPSVNILGSHIMAVRGGTPAAEAFAPLEPRVEVMLDDLAWWTEALGTARALELVAEEVA